MTPTEEDYEDAQIAVVLWELERPLDEKTAEFYAWLDVYAGLVFLQAEAGKRDREQSLRPWFTSSKGSRLLG
ncbi:MAG TPA: hypothetical protein VJX47_06365 [Candidatus Sulfotelmatobacter sp.]|nr:hypothetical protein [Candidatus Sulfotelmatobacter sp.]